MFWLLLLCCWTTVTWGEATLEGYHQASHCLIQSIRIRDPVAAARRGKEYATKHLALLPDPASTAQCIAILLSSYGPVKDSQGKWDSYEGENLADTATMGTNLQWSDLKSDMAVGTYWMEGTLVVPDNAFDSTPLVPVIKLPLGDSRVKLIDETFTGVKPQCYFQGVTRTIKSCYDSIKAALTQAGVSASRAAAMLLEAKIDTNYKVDMIKPSIGANLIIVVVTPRTKDSATGDNWKISTVLPHTVKGPVLGRAANDTKAVYNARERVKHKCKNILQSAKYIFTEYARQAGMTYTDWLVDCYTKYPATPTTTKANIVQWVTDHMSAGRGKRAAQAATPAPKGLEPVRADLTQFYRVRETVLEELGAAEHSFDGKVAAGVAGLTAMALLRQDTEHQYLIARKMALIKYETSLVDFHTRLEANQQAVDQAKQAVWDGDYSLCTTENITSVWCNLKRFPAYIIESMGLPTVRIVLKHFVTDEYFQIRCLPILTDTGEWKLFRYNGQVAREQGRYLANAENRFLAKCLDETQTHVCKVHYRDFDGTSKSDPPEFSQMIGLPVNDDNTLVISTGSDRRVTVNDNKKSTIIIGSEPQMLSTEQFPIKVEGTELSLSTFRDQWEVRTHPLDYINQFPLEDWPKIVDQAIERHGWTWLYNLLRLREDGTSDFTITIVAVMTGVVCVPLLSVILCFLLCRYNICCKETVQDLLTCLANLCGRLQNCCNHCDEPTAPPLYQDEAQEAIPLAALPPRAVVPTHGSRFEVLPYLEETEGNPGSINIVTVTDPYSTRQHGRGATAGTFRIARN